MDMCNLKCKICHICNREFCSKNPNTQLSQHLRWCSSKTDFLNKYNLDSSKIEEEYYITGSVLSFKDKYPFWDNFVHYYKLFKELNVKVSLKDAHNNQKTKDKRTDTFIKKYGYSHNFLKNTDSRKEWEKRLFEEEGIINVFQREGVKKKSAQTIVRKYEKELWLHSLTVRGKGVISRLNKQIFDILNQYNIEFQIEFKIETENSYYSYDILLENNKIIEVNGNYWHGNPALYKADDIILKGSSKEMLVSTKWKYDKEKTDYILAKGFQVLVIWEKDMKDNIDNVILKILEYAKS